MVVLYGIKNCDTVKKARRWLDAHGIAYRFHDVRADGLEEKRLAHWLKHSDWESLLNRRGTRWRGLSAAERESVTDAAGASSLMLCHPTLIKRPVLEYEGGVRVGFNEADYAALFAPAGHG